MEKLYVVVREDLAPGLALAQACHAATLWGAEAGASPEQNLVVLGVPSKEALAELLFNLERSGARKVWFTEPDLGGELTAVACQGEPSTVPLLSSLPLAHRQRAA